MASITLFGAVKSRLGESPVWDDVLSRLWWVDSVAGRIHAAAPDGAPIADFSYDQPIGSIGLATGGLVAAMADGFYQIDGLTGIAMPIALPQTDPRLRFNDGKADRSGRFLSGQLRNADPDTPDAGLWRLDSDGTAHRLTGGLDLANAICFSPDGTTLYFADSLEGIVRAHPYDPATGAIGPRTDAFDCRPHGSGPDGATVDADGNLWIALVLAGTVACFTPQGKLLRSIALPAPYPSCVAFGGPQRDILFVTTISDSGHRLKSDSPQSGRVLAITGLGVVGLPEGRYAPMNHMGE
jgi:sugar lactone lactonase YvrE